MLSIAVVSVPRSHATISGTTEARIQEQTPALRAQTSYSDLSKQVKKPKPVKEYTALVKKFSHLSNKELEVLQQDVDYENRVLQQLCRIEAECPLPGKEVVV